MEIVVPRLELYSINELEYMVMRYVWERETMRSDEVKSMLKSIEHFVEVAGRTLNQDIYFVMKSLSQIIIDADSGKYDDRKKLYKDHKIDWKKVYGIPGSRSPAEIAKAQQALREWERDHPELATQGRVNGVRSANPN
jgi:hypothetical protein